MAERRTRRRFTREYKAQAVQRLIESGRPLTDIAMELDVSPGQLSQWRNEQLAAGSAEALAHCQEGRVHEGLWRYQHAERTLAVLQTSRLK